MPPGEIPWEASDTLAFTPECLKHLPNPPVFTLRAITSRDKRHQRRLALKHVTIHSEDALRAIIREELLLVWSQDHCERFLPHLEEYWSALDDWKAQVAEDPEVGDFEYDPEMRAAINKLYDELRRNSDRYADALADNADAGDIMPLLLMAVAIESFTGLDAKAEPVKVDAKSAYFTLDGVEAILGELAKVEKAAEASDGQARAELLIACSGRYRLDEAEVGNSVSPSPSEAAPTSSSDATDSADPGTSPASAKSPKKTSGA